MNGLIEIPAVTPNTAEYPSGIAVRADSTPIWALSLPALNLLDFDNSQAGEAVLKNCGAVRIIGHDAAAVDPADLIPLIEWCGRHAVAYLSLAPATVAGPGGLSYQDALNHTLHLTRTTIPHLEQCGVTLCLQAATGGFLLSAPELRELIDLANSANVGVDLAAGLDERDDRAAVRDWLDTLGARVHLLGLALAQAAYARLLVSPDEAADVAGAALTAGGLPSAIAATVVLRLANHNG